MPETPSPNSFVSIPLSVETLNSDGRECCRVLTNYLHALLRISTTQVGAIGGNLIYAIKATEMFAIKPADAASGALSSTAGHGTDSNAFVSTLAKVNRRLNPTQRYVVTGNTVPG